jgi:hypothetical protein
MKRREFIAGLGGAMVWPLAATAQQTMPAIGFLSSGSPDKTTDPMQAFYRGLSEAGYHEGRNVAIEYRWGDGYGRLAEMASDLVQRKVAAIVAAVGASGKGCDHRHSDHLRGRRRPGGVWNRLQP